MATHFKSIEKTLSFLSSLSSNPLFSTIITLHTIILIFLPTFFFKIIFSPILIATGTLLLLILRLGAIQNKQETKDLQKVDKHEVDQDSKSTITNCFFEWNVKAPLEVIYEAYEGEEEETDVVVSSKTPKLLVYYLESDSNGSSEDDDWDSPERMWEEEDKDDLIEISLDDHKRNMDCYNYAAAEEEELIEIDLFPNGIRYS